MIVSHQWPRERTWGVAPATFRAKKTTEKGVFLAGGTTHPEGKGQLVSRAVSKEERKFLDENQLGTSD